MIYFSHYLLDMNKITDGVFLSDIFKTSYAFKFQPVSISSAIDLWVRLVRPQTRTTSPYLFVTHTGDRLGQGYISNSINTYFSLFNLDISVNTFRKMIQVCVCHLFIMIIIFLLTHSFGTLDILQDRTR